MVTDNDIAYAESLVRRLEESLAVKRRAGGNADEIAKLEAELVLRKRDAQDLRNRKRHNDDQEKRDKEQKERDDRRHRLA